MCKKIIYYLLSLLSIIILYHMLSITVNNEMILPKLSLIVNYIIKIKSGVFLTYSLKTISKTIVCFVFSLLVSLILAVIAYNKGLSRIINPYMSILKTIPTISIILMAIIWLGNEKAIYLIPVLVIIPLLYESFIHHLKNIDPKLVEVCVIYKFNLMKKIRYLYFYHLLEGFILSLKQTIGLCFKIIVMAEVIGQAQIGIGAIMQNEKVNLNMSGVFAWTVILIIYVLIIDLIIDVTAKKVIKWKCYYEN